MLSKQEILEPLARVRERLSRGSVTLHVSATREHRGEAVQFAETTA